MTSHSHNWIDLAYYWSIAYQLNLSKAVWAFFGCCFIVIFHSRENSWGVTCRTIHWSKLARGDVQDLVYFGTIFTVSRLKGSLLERSSRERMMYYLLDLRLFIRKSVQVGEIYVFSLYLAIFPKNGLLTPTWEPKALSLTPEAHSEESTESFYVIISVKRNISKSATNTSARVLIPKEIFFTNVFIINHI